MRKLLLVNKSSHDSNSIVYKDDMFNMKMLFMLFILNSFSFANDAIEILSSNINLIKKPDYNLDPATSAPLKGDCHGQSQEIFTKDSFKIDCSGDKPILVKTKASLTKVQLQEHYANMYEIFKVFNLATKKEMLMSAAGDKVLTQRDLDIIKKYAQTPYGHENIMKVLEFNSDWTSKGNYKYKDDYKENCKDVASVFTGEPSEELEFSDDSPKRFLIFGVADSKGAWAEPASIKIGEHGFNNIFPTGGQKVDPLAIIHHEFCHTKFGITHNTTDLKGEAQVVRECENPVRETNGHDKRMTYYDPDIKKTIHVYTGHIYDGRWRWDSKVQLMIRLQR